MSTLIDPWAEDPGKPDLFSHQKRIISDTSDIANYAMFWEQRTAKTRPCIKIAAHNFRIKRIDALVIVTDDGVHSNWIHDEIPAWMPADIPYDCVEYNSDKAETKTQQNQVEYVLRSRGLAILAMSWGAVSRTERGKLTLWRFLRDRKVLFIADETNAIENPSATLTDIMIGASKHAVMRRILTGTPVGNSPMGIYSQIQFLDPDFWSRELNIKSFTAFKNEFAVMKPVYLSTSKYYGTQVAHGQKPQGRPGKDYFPTTIAFKNMNILNQTLKKISDRVLQSDVFDLPEKIYGWEYYKPSPQESRIYNQLKEEAMASVGDETMPCVVCNGSQQIAGEDCPQCLGSGLMSAKLMTATMPIVRLLRFQQILSGYEVADNEPIRDIPGPKPRLEALERILKRGSGEPQIVWSRFTRDVDKIYELCKDMGLKVGNYDGRTSTDDRTEIRRQFQGGELDVFNGNVAISKGYTLTMAHHVTYYNNTFRVIHRLQSEDRPISGAVKHSVGYTDIAVHGWIDHHIARRLRKKMDVASEVTGDALKKWLI